MFRIRLAGLAATCALAQSLAPIRVDVRLVTASFTVRDSAGKLIPDLSKEEVELLDDGIPQPIAFFSRSLDMPLSLALVVDASPSQTHFIDKHGHDLKRFLKDVLTPRDRAFLLCFGNHPRIAADYTDSPDRLLDGLKRFEKPKNREDMPELGP